MNTRIFKQSIVIQRNAPTITHTANTQVQLNDLNFIMATGIVNKCLVCVPGTMLSIARCYELIPLQTPGYFKGTVNIGNLDLKDKGKNVKRWWGVI